MPSEKQVEERKDNIHKILSYLRINSEASRRTLSSELNLSWGCISELTAILICNNILKEEKAQSEKAKGRQPSVLKLNPDICFLGIDINIMGLTGCVCNFLGEKIYTKKGIINCTSKSDFEASVIGFTTDMLNTEYNILGICFAMQGIYDKNDDCWDFPVKEVGKINFEDSFKEILEIPIITEHDPDCILYGCLEKSDSSKMMVRLDKGIGVSVYKNGRFLKDEFFELGYLVMNEKGDTLKELVSLEKIEKAEMNLNNTEFEKYLNSSSEYLGCALGNVCNLIRLDTIYLCGDIISKYKIVNDDFYKTFEKTAISKKTCIKTVEVTDGAYGAAKLAVDNFRL